MKHPHSPISRAGALAQLVPGARAGVLRLRRLSTEWQRALGQPAWTAARGIHRRRGRQPPALLQRHCLSAVYPQGAARHQTPRAIFDTTPKNMCLEARRASLTRLVNASWQTHGSH